MLLWACKDHFFFFPPGSLTDEQCAFIQLSDLQMQICCRSAFYTMLKKRSELRYLFLVFCQYHSRSLTCETIFAALCDGDLDCSILFTSFINLYSCTCVVDQLHVFICMTAALSDPHTYSVAHKPRIRKLVCTFNHKICINRKIWPTCIFISHTLDTSA